MQDQHNKDKKKRGSAKIVTQEVEDTDFEIPRGEYLNALLYGEAAILKQLDPNCELNDEDVTHTSSSDDHQTRLQYPHRETDRQKTLSSFPFDSLKDVLCIMPHPLWKASNVTP